ncbi:DivIVA domain-containing protein [Fusibacter paucivorans]|uniref:DivIVA domain-containing protein n=1 Tax=Fusibacter paucivorans TaxID=76009 RepID=A0ABS5PS57_9FIRM|nr:DivIVA domain-containing protein [Fusibacter paucivorans]MBS7527401.1 DivIVA domain-containing protein [Fusibacter paucivorans]
MIKPIEIQHKEFTKTVRGYNPTEVDEYLAMIVKSMEELIQTNIEITAQVKMLERDMTRYVQMEKTINDAMILAQKTSDEMIKATEEKAKYILERAETEAEKIMNTANIEVLEAIKRKEEAVRDYMTFVTKFKVLLEGELKGIDAYDIKGEKA